MIRIIAQVDVANPLQPENSSRFDALVDTGASLLVLPKAWKDRFGWLSAGTGQAHGLKVILIHFENSQRKSPEQDNQVVFINICPN